MKRRIWCVFLALCIVALSFHIFTLIPLLTKAQQEIGIFSDGGFENGTVWSSGRTESDEAFEGQYVIAAANHAKTRRISTYFSLEKNTDYSLNFWYKNPSLDDADQFGIMVGSNIHRAADLIACDRWTFGSISFNTGEYDSFRLGLRGFDFMIDAVSITYKTVGNAVSNDSFELGMSDWYDLKEEFPTIIVSDSPVSGFVCASLANGDGSGIGCDVKLAANTKYELTFSYKGGGADAWYGVAGTKSTLAEPVFLGEKQFFENSEDWKQASFHFDSGEKTAARVLISLGASGALQIDDVRVVRDETVNLVVNGGFEDSNASWTNVKSEQIVTANRNAGSYSAKLVQTKYGKMYQKIPVEPGKKYVISFNRRSGDYSQWAICDGALAGPVVNRAETGFIAGNNMTGSAGQWVSEFATFDSGNCTSVYVVFQSAQANTPMMIDDVYVAEKPHTAEDDLVLTNGGFENGLDGWEQSWLGAVSLTDDAKTGAYALQLIQHSSYPKVGQSFAVSAGKAYIVFFSVKGNCAYTKWSVSKGGAKFVVEPSNPSFVIGGTLTYNTTDWVAIRSDAFSVEEDDTYYLNFQSNGNIGLSTVVDDIFILEFDSSSLVLNGDFEGILGGWNYDEDTFELAKEAYSGTYSLHATSGYHKSVSQKIKLEKDTKYALSFRYKGNVPDDISVFAVSPSQSFNDACVLKSSLSDSEDWKQVKMGFDSGDGDQYYLLFQTMEGCDYYLDAVEIYPSNENIPFGKQVKNALFLGTNSKNPYNSYPYITDESHNVIGNSGFEGSVYKNKSANTADLLGDHSVLSTDPSVAFRGDACLKFKAGDELQVSSMKLLLKKNTVYWMTLFVKTPKYPGNDTFATFGVSEPDNGDYLVFADPNTEANRLYTKTIQMIPTAADNAWHLVTFSFETNDVDQLYFTIQGRNVELYFDDLYLFEEQYAIQYQSPIESLTDVSVTDDSPKNLGVKSESMNLLENYDLNDGDTYWSDTVGTLFGTSLNDADSKHSIYGKSLYYESVRQHPNRIYYIKWIDVEPHTEYTFSAKYCITSTGDGAIGLLSGEASDYNSQSENVLYPTVIKKIDYSPANFDKNCNWQDFGVSFNTNDRNRIGIFVFDGGGTAYLDDLRLFETANGTKLQEKEENFPDSLVSKNAQITVAGGKLSGAKEGSKISNLISSFKNSEYIRAFDASGNEITDYKGEIFTGLQLRLMNGPTIKDRTDVILYGDVNGDGVRNKSDSEAILDYLSRKKVLQGIYLEAADYDRDGEVTVHDLMGDEKTPSSGTVKASFIAPKAVQAGEEILVKLSVDADSVRALNGMMSFYSGTLTPVEVFSDNPNLQISSTVHGNEIWFSALAGKGISGKQIISVAFRVGNIAELTDAGLKIEDLTVTTGRDILSYQPEPESFTPSDFERITIEEIKGESTTELARNRLAVLKLEEAEIVPDFDPEIKEYTATVPYSVKKVTVTAIAADEDATVTIGKTELKYVGKNNVTVKVVSADGLKRTYVIVVKREAPKKAEQAKGISPWVIVAIAAGAAMLLAGTVLMIVFLVKRKKKKKNNRI